MGVTTYNVTPSTEAGGVRAQAAGVRVNVVVRAVTSKHPRKGNVISVNPCVAISSSNADNASGGHRLVSNHVFGNDSMVIMGDRSTGGAVVHAFLRRGSAVTCQASVVFHSNAYLNYFDRSGPHAIAIFPRRGGVEPIGGRFLVVHSIRRWSFGECYQGFQDLFGDYLGALSQLCRRVGDHALYRKAAVRFGGPIFVHSFNYRASYRFVLQVVFIHPYVMCNGGLDQSTVMPAVSIAAFYSCFFRVTA